MIESQRHSYHLVDLSPWPILGSLGALANTVGGMMYMHSFQGGTTLLSLGLILILYTIFVWWRDVLCESMLEGHHTKAVQLGPRYGSILFIVSEVMFLFAFLGAYSHSSLTPTVEIGGIWPPKGIGVLDPREISFLNTPILPSSGAAITWAHHAILVGKVKRAVYALVPNVSLALVSTGFQGMEYYQALSTISDSIYGSIFFSATGFHVIIGTLFLIIYGIRQYLGHLTKEHYVGFEVAAWYWNFVDVVRLFPFISVYLVGRYMKEQISGLRNESSKTKRTGLFQRMTVTTPFIQKEKVDYFPSESLYILAHKLGIEEIMADYVHQEMTLKWILVYLILFLFIIIKDVFLFGLSFFSSLNK